MERLLDLFLRSPLARRYLAGYAERGLILLLGALATYAQLEPGTFESDAAKVAAEWGPVLAGALLVWLAQLRMRKAEKTIQAAQVSDVSAPRAEIDAKARAAMKGRYELPPTGPQPHA